MCVGFGSHGFSLILLFNATVYIVLLSLLCVFALKVRIFSAIFVVFEIDEKNWITRCLSEKAI